MSTGNQIQALREKRDWSRADLADRLGCRRMTVYRLETGKTMLREEVLRKLAEIFETTVDELLA